MKEIQKYTLEEIAAECKRRPNNDDTNPCDGCPCDPWCHMLYKTPDEWKFLETKEEAAQKEPEPEPEPKQEPELTKQQRPRICDFLGVEVDQEFSFSADTQNFLCAKVNQEGRLMAKGEKDCWSYIGAACVCWLLNHPDSIGEPQEVEPVRTLTDDEMMICKILGARWVTRNKSGRSVWLRNSKPAYLDGRYVNVTDEGDEHIANVKANMFPSVKPGDCIRVAV